LRPPSPSLFCTDTTGSCHHRPPELPRHRRTLPPKASSTTSTPRRHSSELHPRQPCSSPSLWPPRAHRQHLATDNEHARRSCPAGRCSVGPGCQAEAQPAFWPAMHSRPPCPTGCSPGPDQARHCTWIKKSFLIYLIPEILANFQNS
jgi:hypothetical protein